MSNNLGEIFYNGRIMNLSSLTENELQNMINELEASQVNKKENIKKILKQMEG